MIMVNGNISGKLEEVDHEMPLSPRGVDVQPGWRPIRVGMENMKDRRA
jgi:hypothetical protein